MSETSVFEGKHLRVLSRGGWEYVERKSAKEAVAVVALTQNDRLVLTEQYRRSVDARVIDLPAGLVGDEDGTDDPEATAKKELDEETGYDCASVRLLARGPSSPGITSEIVSLYRAEGLRRKSEGGGVSGEDITVHVIATSELSDWLRRKQEEGVLVDLKIWGALHFLA